MLRTATALAFVFVVAAAAVYESQLHRVLHDAHPTGDLAVFETNVRMALQGVQRFGPYSQGFRHPGPSYSCLLALPYAISGGTTFSLYSGAQALSILFIASCAVAVSRWGATIGSRRLARRSPLRARPPSTGPWDSGDGDEPAKRLPPSSSPPEVNLDPGR